MEHLQTISTWFDLQTISIGFDIATAVSIIGAVIVFIINTRQENKKIIGEERKNERVKILSGLLTTYREKYLFPILAVLAKEKPDPEAGVAARKGLELMMGELKKFLQQKAEPTAAIYFGKEDFEGILEMRKLSHTIFPEINKILSDEVSQEDKVSRVIGVFDKYTLALIMQEAAMVIRLRRLMHNESKRESGKIWNMYALHRYERGEVDLSKLKPSPKNP
ncbi:MAG: hypothetical protein A6F72_09340 [Cycloclasticus sp. symbiont of Poecilosclerida sp. N]|nr:MAG: hypothetical protein A6F72_09340 [Cycloclasticus sp. symbiont of Poecilosclerida sp. N]